MSQKHDIVFLFDVDNTLLDNDRIKRALGERLDSEVGNGSSAAYWRNYETLRDELGHSDFLRTFQRCWQDSGRDPRWLPAASFLLEYPFRDALYPRAGETLAHLAKLGPVVIVSDGDAVLQPRKISQSGIWDAVEGRVLIYQHKEHELDDIARRFPAEHYVMVDDKLRVLDAMKKTWADRLTTVFPQQGHYALDPKHTDGHGPADFAIDQVGALADWDRSTFTTSVRSQA